MAQQNYCQSTTQYSWDADKVATLIRLHAEHSHYFNENQNSSRYAWDVIERKLNMPVSLLIDKWNNILQEYQVIKTSEGAKRLEWPFFNLMDAYLRDETQDPMLPSFSSSKAVVSNYFDHNGHLLDDPIKSSAITTVTAISNAMQGDQSREDVPSNKNDQFNHKNEQYLLTGNMEPLYLDFYDFQKAGKMVDVTIAAGGELFEVHKLVLAVCSPYFQMILLQDPSPHPTIFMPDVDSSHMAGLIEFMYTGKVYVDHENLPVFMKTAKSMQIKGFHFESTPGMDESPTQRKESKAVKT